MPMCPHDDGPRREMCSNGDSNLPAQIQSVILTLRWPPPALFPNRRLSLHWSKSHRQKKEYREEAFWLARSAMRRFRFADPPAVEVSFFPPDSRSRDDDGMIGAFKNARDGIAAAIGFDDATWRPVYTFHPPQRPDGKIVVVLTVRGTS